MQEPLTITVEPADPERNRRLAQFRRNGEWLSEQGPRLFDAYAGRYIAVSKGEVFAAANRDEARRLALAKHPDDEPFVQFVPRERMARIYAC